MKVETIEAVGQAMVDGRWVDVLDHISPNVRAHVPGVGDVEGLDGLASFLLDTQEKSDSGEHFELLDTLVGKDYSALYFRITAERAGRAPLDNKTVHLARTEGEQIVEIWFHNFDTKAVVDFWA